MYSSRFLKSCFLGRISFYPSYFRKYTEKGSVAINWCLRDQIIHLFIPIPFVFSQFWMWSKIVSMLALIILFRAKTIVYMVVFVLFISLVKASMLQWARIFSLASLFYHHTTYGKMSFVMTSTWSFYWYWSYPFIIHQPDWYNVMCAYANAH